MQNEPARRCEPDSRIPPDDRHKTQESSRSNLSRPAGGCDFVGEPAKIQHEHGYRRKSPSIPPAFLSELSLGGFPATKPCAGQERRRGGTSDFHIQKVVGADFQCQTPVGLCQVVGHPLTAPASRRPDKIGLFVPFVTRSFPPAETLPILKSPWC